MTKSGHKMRFLFRGMVFDMLNCCTVLFYILKQNTASFIQILFMKKIIGFLLAGLMVTVLSCEEKPAKVVVVPVTPVIIVKDPPAKGTTIILDKNGVKVETKKAAVTIKN